MRRDRCLPSARKTPDALASAAGEPALMRAWQACGTGACLTPFSGSEPPGGFTASFVASVAGVLFWLLATLTVLTAVPAWGQQSVPALTGRVVDTVGILQPDQRASLARTLADLEARKGAQLAVLIVGTTEPEPIESYSIRVAEAWKLGRAQVDGRQVDDGALFLIAIDDRRMRIEVGYGLEGAIPDALAKRVIAEQVTPAFRDGDYARGIEAGVRALVGLIDGEPLPAPTKARDPGGAFTAETAIMLAFFGFTIGVLSGALVGKWPSYVIGSGFSGIAAWLMTAGLIGIVGSAIGASLMLLLTSGTGAGGSGGGLRRSGRHTWTSGGWGGGGGFGGGGGGFSGGGGGFGGGGASGGW
ncbi:MAG: TPM domain-containing protein [Burkholderiaceae bacterium]